MFLLLYKIFILLRAEPPKNTCIVYHKGPFAERKNTIKNKKRTIDFNALK
jgi:hypothetical protein